MSVRSLILLVACCGALLWAWRHLAENADPARVAARAIQKRAALALKSGTTAERVAAIHQLERTFRGDDSVALPPLIRALTDRDPAIRLAAADALGQVGASAVAAGRERGLISTVMDALIDRLADPVPDVRHAAAVSLGIIAATRPERGVTTIPVDRPALIAALTARIGDPDARVRQAIFHALAAGDPIGPTMPPEILATGFNDEVPAIRLEVIHGLAQFRRGLDPWIGRLLKRAESDPDARVRAACLNVLSHPAFRPPAVTAAAVPAIVDGLRSESVRVRCQVARFAGWLGAEARGAIPELLRLLADPLESRLVPLQSLEFTEDGDPGSEAASALGQIAPGSTDEKAVVTALIDCARHGPLTRRIRTVYALGQFGPAAAEAAPVLIAILDDPEAARHTRAEARAGHLPGSAYVHGQIQTAAALGRVAPGSPWTEPAVAALRRVLHSNVPAARAEAASALARFGSAAAPAFHEVRALTGDDPDPLVRDAARLALPQIEAEADAEAPPAANAP